MGKTYRHNAEWSFKTKFKKNGNRKFRQSARRALHAGDFRHFDSTSYQERTPEKDN